MKTLEQIHSRWRNSTNPPAYVHGKERSEFLVGLVRQYAESAKNVLELGCNVGRNLDALYQAGLDVAGVDINENAFDLMKEVFSGMAGSATLHPGSIEAFVERQTKPYELIVTMSVLSHIHPESEWVFAQIARLVGDTLIIIEDEQDSQFDFVFARKYQPIFEGLGLTQVAEYNCADVPGLDGKYWARVFKKQPVSKVVEPEQTEEVEPVTEAKKRRKK